LDVVVGGATGKLGSMVCDLVTGSDDLTLRGAVVSEGGGHVGREIAPGVRTSGPGSLRDLLDEDCIYVDLTTPEAATGIVSEIPSTGANLIVGTTAVGAEALSRMESEVERCGTSALVSANFATGMNVFWKVSEILARHLPDYDIEIIEAHHSAKRDAPSGTTAETVRRLQSSTGIEDVVYSREGSTGPRKREIGVHALRAGDIIGDHTVILAKNMEMIELTHRTVSREALARGCLESIRWMDDRRDGKVHSMDEVLGL